ncbi:MAG: PQQ-binding-like beta-propeller repeat protein [Thermoproteota archaeon]|nr:PQQ-binding-like beta-propeller repeat protein [Thermoproteota archaeon]
MVADEEYCWKMFRGNAMRTGVSKSKLSKKPHLQWVMELGPIIASPVVEKGIVYVLTITGRVFAVNVYQRKIKWCLNTGSPLVSSPLLQKDLLVAATFESWVEGTRHLEKNRIFALDTRTGEESWNFEIDGDIFSSPCITHNTIMFGTKSKILFAIDTSGNLKWMFKTQGEIWSSPSSNGDLVFVGSDDGFMYCLDLDGKVRWKTKLDGKIRSSSPCLSEDNTMVFVGTHSGSIYCLNQSSGSIKWTKQLTKPVLSSAALFKNRIYIGASDHKLHCLDSDRGSQIWEFATGGKIWSSPVVAESNEVLFFGSLDSHVYGLDVTSGNQTWKFPTMDMVDSSPCIANGMLFVGSRDGLLYVFGPQGITGNYIG